jgi:Spx/MgsR family transcriptional regulator
MLVIFANVERPCADANSYTLQRILCAEYPIQILGVASKKRRAMKSPARKPASRAKKSGKALNFLGKPTCPTCRKARRFLEKRGYQLNYRNLVKDRLSPAELEKLIGKHDHEDFLNPRSETFRKKKMNDNPPSRRDAISLMARNPDLIRRPVIVAGGRVVIGYDKNGMIRF